jgi:proteic killer suppression protein
MITFTCRETEKVWQGKYSKKFPAVMQDLMRRKLIMLDAAEKLETLKVPPGNHLEELKGDRKGQYSIRINDKYRVCFKWTEGNAYDVEIVDYHK